LEEAVFPNVQNNKRGDKKLLIKWFLSALSDQNFLMVHE